VFVVKYFIFTWRKRLRQVKYNPFQKEMQAFQQNLFQIICLYSFAIKLYSYFFTSTKTSTNYAIVFLQLFLN